MATLIPNPADDIFGDDELDEASETQPRSQADEERRFQERIAFVCTMMKVPNLYPEQVQVLRALEKGKDVCLLARTGFGKSLVFQALYWMHI